MSERRTYNERRSYSARVMRFRQAVYEPREGMTNGCRVLLLRLSDDMDATLKVSIPRADLAAHLGVAPARITESIALAKRLGFLDTVRRARQHITAVYAGTIPPSEVRHAVPLDDDSEVRPPGPHEVRPAVPLGGVQRYALPMPQEEEGSAGNDESDSGSVWETKDSHDERGSVHANAADSFLLALENLTTDCPHGIPMGLEPAPWDQSSTTCPECHAARSKSDRDRWSA